MPDNRKKRQIGGSMGPRRYGLKQFQKSVWRVQGSMGHDMFGCINGFEVSFRNMSKICSCESNLSNGLGESDKQTLT